MADTQRTYLPAAGRDWALPLYDPLVKLLGADSARKALLDQAAVQHSHRVLDIGCGTGTLALLIKRQCRGVEVTGIDPDPKALARAKRKAARAQISLRFDQGSSDELPYTDASFDRAFSSFMFHHLAANQRERTLREVRRVLAPGGSIHLVDFVRPEEHEASWWTRLFYSNPHLKDNSDSRILGLLRGAGFVRPEKVKAGAIFLGILHIAYYRALVPAA